MTESTMRGDLSSTPWNRKSYYNGPSIPPAGSFTVSSANRRAESRKITHRFRRRGFFLLAAAARDYLAEKRIDPLTACLAIVLFVSQPIEGIVVGPSLAWHSIAAWLTR